MDLHLTKKSVLITGASKGIGFGVAESFAKEGADVTLVSRSKESLELAAEKLRAQYLVAVNTIALDLSKSDSVQQLLDQSAEVDVLVNNAGAIPSGDIEAVDEKAWREAWDLKVYGYINMTRAFYELMKQRDKSGVIINVTGAAGTKMIYDYAAGSSGNAALEAFTRTVGSFSIDHGVRIVAVSPGAIATERIVTLLRHAAKVKFGDEEQWQKLLVNMPQGRAGTVEEIADIAVFLASDKASYISGSVHLVDGGFSARNGFFG